jgi:transcriptional regulator GlxA family with amidase domain
MADEQNDKQRNVAILIFDDVEVLDFAGPFEVFNVTGKVITPAPFKVFTVGVEAFPIEARGKLSVNPHFSIEDMPPADIVLIPGGIGTRMLLQNSEVIAWLKAQYESAEWLLSVCTGALVLAKSGLLDGKQATTHHTAFDELRGLAPNCTLLKDRRYVQSGKVITSGGISAGIDMSLYVVEKLLGQEKLQLTLDEMEYTWSPEPQPTAQFFQAE